jgi:hypothetical protein
MIKLNDAVDELEAFGGVVPVPFVFELDDHGNEECVGVHDSHGHPAPVFLAFGCEEGCLLAGLLVQEDLPVARVEVVRDGHFAVADFLNGVVASGHGEDKWAGEGIEGSVGDAEAEDELGPVNVALVGFGGEYYNRAVRAFVVFD